MPSQNTKTEQEEVKRIIKKKVKKKEKLKHKFEKSNYVKAKSRGLYLKNVFSKKEDFSKALHKSFK